MMSTNSRAEGLMESTFQREHGLEDVAAAVTGALTVNELPQRQAYPKPPNMQERHSPECSWIVVPSYKRVAGLALTVASFRSEMKQNPGLSPFLCYVLCLNVP